MAGFSLIHWKYENICKNREIWVYLRGNSLVH